MSNLVSAIGIGGIGTVFGFMLFYSFRRQQTPLVDKPLSIPMVLYIMGTIGAGGTLGSVYLLLEGVNYIGPYGIGFFLGFFMDVYLTMKLESRSN